MSKQRKEKNVFQWIIAAFLSVFFLEIQLGVFMLAAPFNENMLERGITENGLIQICVDTFKEKWEQELQERGMPADFAEELVDKTILYSAFLARMENKGSEEGETKGFQRALKEKMTEYLKSKGIGGNEAVENAANQFIKEVTASYNSYICPVFIRKFYSVKKQTEKSILLYLVGSIVCSILSCICLVKVSHYCHWGIHLISVSLVTAMVSFGVVIMHLHNKVNMWIAAMQPDFYQELIREYEKYFGQTAVIIIIAGIASFLLLQISERQMRMQGK